MSAVDTTLPMFHAVSGVFFQRQPDGAVRLMLTNGEMPRPEGSNLRGDVLIPHQTWVGAVAASSARGDTQEGITAAEEFLRAGAVGEARKKR